MKIAEIETVEIEECLYKLRSIEQTYLDTPLYSYYSARSIVSATKWSGKSQLRKDRAVEHMTMV